MPRDSSSEVGSDDSPRPPLTSAPSSPPPAFNPNSPRVDSAALENQQLIAEEETARVANDKAEVKRRAALLKRRQKQKAHSKEEREAKARELDELLRKSAAFSDILTKKTEVLGRLGSSLDGKTLGEHDLKMAEQPKCMVGGTMHPYQLEGLTWLYEICLQGMSGILADEMGLGKTLQAIALIALLREQEDYLGPHLIIAPLSTLSNWIAEFQKWTPSIPVIMYHGTPQERAEILKSSMLKHLEKGQPTSEFPVVCTSYEIILRDRALLAKINWEFIIIDEGHRMKNFDSKLFRELKTFSSATRLLITGTPLQNNLRELWSLLNFLLPTIFTNWEAFETWFDFSDLEDEAGTEQFIGDSMKTELVKKIHQILQPLLLRRVKADVASYLPKKREYVLYAPMTKEQTDLYNVINDKNIDTRGFLENKVVERLTGATNSPAASRKASPPSSRSSSTGFEQGGAEPPAAASAKPSPPAAKSAPPEKIPTNAFTLMMGKGKPQPQAPSSSSVPSSGSAKRKQPPTVEEVQPKSAKSSRHSTPSSVKSQAPGRARKGRPKYQDAALSDDDKLDDDEFEAKLAEQYATVDVDELETALSAEDFERAMTLDLAKKEMSMKKLGNPLVQLRLVCNSPHNFYNPWASNSNLPVDESIVTSSGKMLLLDRLLPALFKQGHKVLIFSQFKTQLDILEDYCRELRKWPVCRIDGSVSQDDRRVQIEQFNTTPKYKIFLLSTRAGGQGINLASADTVILFDSDWNPQQDLQAQDRAHRIGQTRPVVVFRLATRGTVEEELLMSADAKRRLEKLVIRKGGFRNMAQKIDVKDDLDKETLRTLLLRDGEVYRYSGEQEVLSDEDLRVLLDRSDAAYARAATGQGNAQGYTVVETGVDGITESAKAS